MQLQKRSLTDAGRSQQSIDEIELEHRDFLRDYCDEPGFKCSTDAKAAETSDYDKLWNVCSARFRAFRNFAEG